MANSYAFYKTSGGIWKYKNNTSAVKSIPKGAYRINVDGTKIEIEGGANSLSLFGGYIEVTDMESDAAGTKYASVAAFEKVANDFINNGSVTIKDVSNNDALVSIFGDQVSATRTPHVALEFQYGYVAGDATVTTANGGAAAAATSLLTVSSSTHAAGSASFETKNTVRYIPGHEIYALFTASFATAAADSTQYSGIMDANDGFGVGYTDGDLVFIRRRAGVQTDYAIDTANGFTGYDPTQLNIYLIRFGYLGVAPPSLYVVNPWGGFSQLMEVEFPNTGDVTHITQTHLPWRCEVANAGNTSNIAVITGSVALGVIDGSGRYPNDRFFSATTGVVTIASGDNILITYRNKSTFKTISNKITALLKRFNGSVDGTKNVSIGIFKDPTFSNSPTWANVDTNDSVMEYSTDATYSANGTLLMDFDFAKTGSGAFNLAVDEIQLRPGEVAGIIATSTAASDVKATFRWVEQF
jgi:hypothetical protein